MSFPEGTSGERARRGGAAFGAALGAAALVAYASLASRDYAAVDGGVRALEVLRRTVGPVGGNNHLLYPAYVRAWTAGLRVLGEPLADPAAFLRAAQLLNALAAAVAVALLFALARRVAGSGRVAALAALGFGCSHALLLHATHGSEPLIGLAWSLFGAWLLVRGVDRASWPHLAAGGAVQAVAMASYQSMVLVAPALAVYAWLGGPRTGRWRRAAWFVGLALLATGALYAAAYACSGTSAPGPMLARVLRLDGGPRVFAGFGVTKTLNLPLGLASAVAPVRPQGYAGLRSLLDGRVPWLSAVLALGAAAVALGGAAALVALAVRAARRAPRDGRARAAWIAGLVAAAGALVPLAWWDPLYDKLWLQPLALAALAVSVLVPLSRRGHVQAALVAVALLVGGVNVAGTVRAHRSPTPCLDEARRVARLVAPRDLLVRGWDVVSFAFGVFEEPRAHTLDLVQAAIDAGPAAAARLDAQRRAASARGAAVWYLGVLDADSAAWDAFLGRRAGLPWGSLAGPRRDAAVRESFACGGARVTLRMERAP